MALRANTPHQFSDRSITKLNIYFEKLGHGGTAPWNCNNDCGNLSNNFDERQTEGWESSQIIDLEPGIKPMIILRKGNQTTGTVHKKIILKNLDLQ